MITGQQSELFWKIDIHITKDDKPSAYLNGITDPVFSQNPFSAISDLKKVPQSPKHHPEGSVWNHTLMVVDEAAKRKRDASDSRSFMWAALLHDIGKAPTTKKRKGKLSSYNHDKVGADMALAFLSFFSENEDFISRTVSIVRWHMQLLYVEKNLPISNLEAMVRDLDVEDIALFCLCDRLGRFGADRGKEESGVKAFAEKAQCRQSHSTAN